MSLKMENRGTGAAVWKAVAGELDGIDLSKAPKEQGLPRSLLCTKGVAHGASLSGLRARRRHRDLSRLPHGPASRDELLTVQAEPITRALGARWHGYYGTARCPAH